MKNCVSWNKCLQLLESNRQRSLKAVDRASAKGKPIQVTIGGYKYRVGRQRAALLANVVTTMGLYSGTLWHVYVTECGSIVNCDNNVDHMAYGRFLTFVYDFIHILYNSMTADKVRIADWVRSDVASTQGWNSNRHGNITARFGVMIMYYVLSRMEKLTLPDILGTGYMYLEKI